MIHVPVMLVVVKDVTPDISGEIFNSSTARLLLPRRLLCLNVQGLDSKSRCKNYTVVE